MLEHFGFADEAARVQKAVDAVTGSGVLTRDIGGTATTDEVVDAIIENLRNLEPGLRPPGRHRAAVPPPLPPACAMSIMPRGASRACTSDNEVGTMASTTAVNRPDSAEPTAKPKWYRQLYFWVIVAIVAGVLVGWLAPGFGKAMEPIGTTFVAAMRMLIGPIVFLTIIGGIAGVADLKKVGLTGVKALVYFQLGTMLALAVGLLAINLIPLGEGVNADVSQIEVSETAASLIEKAENQHWWDFLTHIIPTTMADAFVEGDILQIIFLAVIVGVAINALGPVGAPLLDLVQRGTKVMFKILSYIMKLAPLGAFGAMAFAIGKYGISTLASLGIAHRAVLRDLGGVRVRGPGRRHAIPEVQHLQAAALPQGGAAADRRHVDRRAGAARPDAQAGARRREAQRRRARRPHGLQLQPRRCRHLPVARRGVPRPGHRHRPHVGQQLGLMAVMLLTSKGAAGVAGVGSSRWPPP